MFKFISWIGFIAGLVGAAFLIVKRQKKLFRKLEDDMHSRHSAWQSIHASEFHRLEQQVESLTSKLGELESEKNAKQILKD